MDFSGDAGAIQRRICEVPEGVQRRHAVLAALRPVTGEAVLDIGCGGGHLLVELARAVGPGGRAVGLDVSADQVAAARELCGREPAAEATQGDALATGFDDASFDALASIQTLEYIADVDAALAECRRVLRTGGRAALVSVLWDHWRFHGAEPGLNERIHVLFRRHCPHQMLPLGLPSRLDRAGFGGVRQSPLMFLNTALHANSFAYWAARFAARFAVAEGMAGEEAQAWLDQLAEADREGRFGFVSVPVLTTACAL